MKLLWDYYALALGTERLRQLVDANYWQSLTTVFLKDANFIDTARLMGEIRDYERKHLAPVGIKISFAGDVAVSQSLIRGIVSTQLQSLVWSLLGIFAVAAVEDTYTGRPASCRRDRQRYPCGGANHNCPTSDSDLGAFAGPGAITQNEIVHEQRRNGVHGGVQGGDRSESTPPVRAHARRWVATRS